MPKLYYRCSFCHSKVKRGKDLIYRFNQAVFGGACLKCNLYRPLYHCQHNYWWELLYITIRTIFRSIKESYSIFLQYEKDYKVMDKTIKEWSKK